MQLVSVGTVDIVKKKTNFTLRRASFNKESRSTGTRSNKTCELCLNNGNTLRNIMTAIKIEQIGSAIYQLYCWIKSDDTMTPTLPSVSATTCKNTPVNG